MAGTLTHIRSRADAQPAPEQDVTHDGKYRWRCRWCDRVVGYGEYPQSYEKWLITDPCEECDSAFDNADVEQFFVDDDDL